LITLKVVLSIQVQFFPFETQIPQLTLSGQVYSGGYGRGLSAKRCSVQIPPPYTGYIVSKAKPNGSHKKNIILTKLDYDL
jgi:hypothetical protein